MNLEDYAYNEDGRWYVNPQVSLNEQNAFIDNYRNVEAANNAEVERQTSGLGTQVPSQLGNLTGGGGYFKSRYQTTNTNQAVADLKAVAQQQALETLLSNEIAKKQKQYKDAYRAASERAANSNSNSTPLLSDLKGGVDTTTGTSNGSGDDTSGTVSTQSEIGVGGVGSFSNRGDLVWRKGEDEYYSVMPTSANDAAVFWGNPLSAPRDQEEKEYDGNRYVYIAAQNQWYRIVAGPGKRSDYGMGGN